MPVNEAHLERALDAIVAQTRIPAASLCVVCDGSVVFDRSVGIANRISGRPLAPDPIFDLASVTKVIATVPLAACLVRSRRLSFDDEVRRWIPELPPEIRVHHLLSHSSGAAAWSPLYASVDDPEALGPATPS